MFGLVGFICAGDKTSCGGNVVTGTPTMNINGRSIARVGDRIACRRNCVIVTGNPAEIIAGAPIAIHGSQTSGGCICISGNNDFAGDAQTAEAASAVPAALDAGIAYMPETAAALNEDHFVEFRLIDNDGNPIPGKTYNVTDAAGNTASGLLDNDGYAKVEPVKAGACRIEFPELGYGVMAESCPT